MKRFLLAAALLASVSLTASEASAQIGGYQFGVGIQQANCGFNGFGRFFATPREQPPFFAQFPPVYYNEVVPRNYGVSPYAAPAGIAPVEGYGNVVPGNSQTIVNPFFNAQPVAPAPAMQTPTPAPSQQAPPESDPPATEGTGDNSAGVSAEESEARKAPWDKDKQPVQRGDGDIDT